MIIKWLIKFCFHNDEVLIMFFEGALLITSWLVVKKAMRIIITAVSTTRISITNVNSW